MDGSRTRRDQLTTAVGAVFLLSVGLVVLINGGSTIFGVAMIAVALLAAFRGWQRWSQ